MNHIEILSNILNSDQTILHMSHYEERLDKYKKFNGYKTIGSNNDHDIILDLNSTFDLDSIKGFDTILITAGLEVIDNPVEFITKIKNSSETVCIYEYKYDLMQDVDPSWKKHWQSVGLTFNLQRNFDLVNEIFLAQATLHTCKIPYNPKSSEDNPNAIR